MATATRKLVGVDIGTTAVKVAVVPGRGEIWANTSLTSSGLQGVAVNTDAYEVDESNPFIKEQRVDMILQAVSTSLLLLKGRGALTMDAKALGIAICGQMHGLVMWSSTDPVGTVSRMITWEDQRGAADGSVSCLNTRLWEKGHVGPGPLFPGYGCASLGHALEHQPHLFQGPAAYDRAGDIQSYVCCALSGHAPGTDAWASPVMHATEAASWGCWNSGSGQWDMGAAACVHESLPALLPRVVQAGTVVGNAGGAGCHPLFSVLPHCLRGVKVTVGVGDHPASVITVLAPRLGLVRGSSTEGEGRGSTLTLINIGTSAQVAILGPIADSCRQVLPPGCEVRPFIDLPGTSSSVMLMGASMNGGSTLAAVERAVHAAGGGDLAHSACYAWLERDGMRVLREGGPGIRISTLPNPERVPAGWPGASEGGPWRVDPLSPPSLPLTLALTHMHPTGEHGSGGVRLHPGEVYAAAAAAVARTLLDTLPASLVAQIGQGRGGVRYTGGALVQSAVLREAVRREVEGRGGGKAQGEEGPSWEYPAEYAGAIGAALVLEAWLAVESPGLVD